MLPGSYSGADPNSLEFLEPLEGLSSRLRVLRFQRFIGMSLLTVDVAMSRRPSVEVQPRGIP